MESGRESKKVERESKERERGEERGERDVGGDIGMPNRLDYHSTHWREGCRGDRWAHRSHAADALTAANVPSTAKLSSSDCTRAPTGTQPKPSSVCVCVCVRVCVSWSTRKTCVHHTCTHTQSFTFLRSHLVCFYVFIWLLWCLCNVQNTLC